ncbi:MAG TPA: glycosyltransferase family 39 protein [Acetobacteraceae bacterium]|nr:glycosyltransferase family 39 protein [Acetobacteraceae bacterium]
MIKNGRLNAVIARPALVLGALAIALHLWANAGYGIFRDELYYIVCGWHLAWGYMDQPPLSPAIAAASHAIFGIWLPGFRIAPTLCFAATVVLTVQLVRLLGGGLFAARLAGITVFAAGALEVFGLLLTTDLLQPPAWTGCTYALIRAVRDGQRRWWLVLGLVAGVAFLGKYNVAFHVAALGLALLATPQRRALLTWEPWAAAGIVLAFAAPNLLWQQLHGWPFVAHIRDIAAHHTEHLSPLAFAAQELLLLNPATLPVWGAGVVALLAWPRFRDVRWIGIGFLLLMVFGNATQGKPYYVAPAYPGVIAAGAVAWEAWVARAAIRTALTGLVIAGGLALMPLFLPVLPPARLAAYMRWLGLLPSTGEILELGALPQYFADMFGWQAFADAIHAAWRALPPDQQSRAVFIGRNYGEAAAIDVLTHGPDAISTHQSYWYWGPKGHDGSVVLHVGETRTRMLQWFRQVEQVGHIPPGWGMPFEVDQPIWLCRGLRMPMTQFWATHRTDN